MKRLLTSCIAAAVLTMAVPVLAADHPIEHATKASGHAVARAWHGGAKNGQKFLARHSRTRHRRAYHLRKASGHAAEARIHAHKMHANGAAASHGH